MITDNGMTSRNGSADSTGIDPAGRQETQTDAEHVIRGATLTQQAGSICLENNIHFHNEHLKILAEKSNGRGIISGCKVTRAWSWPLCQSSAKAKNV
jgi:hypothetical protein